MAALICRMPPRSSGWRSVAGEAGSTGDLTDELGGARRSEPGLGEELRRHVGDERGDLGLERIDCLGELASMLWPSRARRRHRDTPSDHLWLDCRLWTEVGASGQ